MSNPVQISTSQAQVSFKNVASELMSLSPSAIINLFEIDISQLGFNAGILSQSDVNTQNNTVFKFHNNISLTTNSIFWNNQEYIAAPITTEGFETSAKGSPTSPSLSITVSDYGIPLLTILKQRIRQMGDITGAKISRIRTFARFIDAKNFFNSIPPQNFYPDPSQELPRDIYYIDRIESENKTSIKYVLSPSFVVEGITLPGRIMSQNICPFAYRGEGCLYEFSNRKTYIHGLGNLPSSAPPVADSLNETISSLITGAPLSDRGAYNLGILYNIGDYCYIQNRGINYYFISKINSNASAPPALSGWISDECSKNINGCQLRWQNLNSGVIPFGGFPSINRFQ